MTPYRNICSDADDLTDIASAEVYFMDYNRMSTADMLQYCNEALAWDEFGPVDIFFFESVKKIILGQCTPFDDQADEIEDLMGIERPVTEEELMADYDRCADEFYDEDDDSEDVPVQEENVSLQEQVPNAEETVSSENKTDAQAFADGQFSDGFFNDEDDSDENNGTTKPSNKSFTVEI